MKKKSFLSLVLAVVLMIPCMFLMTACGKGNTSDNGATSIKIDISPIEAFPDCTDNPTEDTILHSQMKFSPLIEVEKDKVYTFVFTKRENENFDKFAVEVRQYNSSGKEYTKWDFIKTVLVVSEEGKEYSADQRDNGTLAYDKEESLPNGTYHIIITFNKSATDIFLSILYSDLIYIN